MTRLLFQLNSFVLAAFSRLALGVLMLAAPATAPVGGADIGGNVVDTTGAALPGSPSRSSTRRMGVRKRS